MGAVIWVVIVLVWGCVLIPMWLRRHDASTERSASAERFGSAVRVLTRRTGEGGSRTLRRAPAAVTAAASSVRASAGNLAASTGPKVRGRMGSLGSGGKGPARKPASVAVTRRRWLAGFFVLAVVTLLPAIFAGGKWITVNLIADLLLVGYLATLRLMVRRERQARRNAVVHAQRERRARLAAEAYEAALAEADLADAQAAQTRLPAAERRPVRVVDLVNRPEQGEQEAALSGRQAVGS
jgi:hypothetical protein